MGLLAPNAHCQALAKAAGSTETNWHAYLSTTEPGGVAGVNARDRIGKGPWQNAKGVVVAKDVEDLHSNSSNINKQTALTEKGETVSGRARDTPQSCRLRARAYRKRLPRRQPSTAGFAGPAHGRIYVID